MLYKISSYFGNSLILVLCCGDLFSSEIQINIEWCANNNGQIEYRTKYGTYVDCVTEQYAVEVEYDYNWKEGIGQSLHYAEATARVPAILLIKRNKSKKDYEAELRSTINFYNLPIIIFTVNEIIE
jgi:hypothetical protein